MILDCCEFYSPLNAEAVGIIEIVAGTGAAVTDLTVYFEPCGGYADSYSDTYSDPTVNDQGVFPRATANAFTFAIPRLEALTTLIVDSSRRRVQILDANSGEQIAGAEVLDFDGLWEWIEATKGACVMVCVDTEDSDTNLDTSLRITSRAREL